MSDADFGDFSMCINDMVVKISINTGCDLDRTITEAFYGIFGSGFDDCLAG